MNEIPRWKRLLYILLLLILAFLVGYLIFTGGNLE